MLKLFDFQCPECAVVSEHLVTDGDSPICSVCGVHLEKILGCAPMFTTIVPTTTTSGALKAGSCHRYWNRPAEKISVSVPK